MPPRSFPRRPLLALSVFSLAAISAALAGPIDPPPGPIVPTGKTLQEIFDKAGASGEKRIPINATTCPGDGTAQFRITQPGSYYLEGNLLGESGSRHVLQIIPGGTLDGVTVDLNGFIIGPELGATINADVINVFGSANRVLIRNGVVRAGGATGDGIDTGGSTAARIENVRISGAGTFGVRGSGAHCENVQVISALSTGFSMGTNALLVNCVAIGCAGNGFSSAASRLINCTATSNTQSGFSSGLAPANFYSGCNAASNTQSGFALGGPARLDSCTASANTLNGFAVAAAAHGSTLVNCSAISNGTDGFSISAGCVVERCTADANGTSGTFSGFRVNGAVNVRLEGNTASRNDTGFLTSSGGTLIIRNTCISNTTNWSIAAGTFLGPIVVPGSNAAAFNGNTAPGTLGTTDTNANFTY